jgi:DNA modification methylase
VTAAPARSPRPALYGDRTRWALVHGDSLALLPLLPDHSVDLALSDPPYGIGIAGHSWDGRYLTEPEGFQAFTTAWAREARRLLRPGGYLAAFGSPRTVHRLVAGIEDAGLEIRDQLLWLYGSGAPKSRRLEFGLGTTLKPSYEPIVLARAPLESGLTVTANLQRHGTGAMDIEGAAAPRPAGERSPGREVGFWPANLALSHEPGCHPERGCSAGCVVPLIDRHANAAARRPGAPRLSRLFYAAKASRVEREAGLQELPTAVSEIFSSGGAGRARANHHPTVKPVSLCRWLVRLLAPPGAVVLDPFAGSGSFGIGSLLEGRRFVGIERELDYVNIARVRLDHWSAAASNELAADPDTSAP